MFVEFFQLPMKPQHFAANRNQMWKIYILWNIVVLYCFTAKMRLCELWAHLFHLSIHTVDNYQVSFVGTNNLIQFRCKPDTFVWTNGNRNDIILLAFISKCGSLLFHSATTSHSGDCTTQCGHHFSFNLNSLRKDAKVQSVAMRKTQSLNVSCSRFAVAF